LGFGAQPARFATLVSRTELFDVTWSVSAFATPTISVALDGV
jgi:hypothetical protein